MKSRLTHKGSLGRADHRVRQTTYSQSWQRMRKLASTIHINWSADNSSLNDVYRSQLFQSLHGCTDHWTIAPPIGPLGPPTRAVCESWLLGSSCSSRSVVLSWIWYSLHCHVISIHFHADKNQLCWMVQVGMSRWESLEFNARRSQVVKHLLYIDHSMVHIDVSLLASLICYHQQNSS